MKWVLIALLTASPTFLAWLGYQTDNDFFLYLFGLIALAPTAALMALKLKWF